MSTGLKITSRCSGLTAHVVEVKMVYDVFSLVPAGYVTRKKITSAAYTYLVV